MLSNPLDSFLVQVLVVFGSKDSTSFLYIRTPYLCSWALSLTWFSLQFKLLPKLFPFPLHKSLQEDYLKLCKPSSTCKPSQPLAARRCQLGSVPFDVTSLLPIGCQSL